MKSHQTKPSFSQNQFKEVTKPVEVKEDKPFPFVQITAVGLLIAFLFTLLHIWLY